MELEDERAVAQVQRGLRGRLWPRGRYAPVAESGVHWFHRRIASALDENRLTDASRLLAHVADETSPRRSFTGVVAPSAVPAGQREVGRPPSCPARW